MGVQPMREIDTLILCGGLGTRLRVAVPDRPKALAEVGGKPFLDILLAELTSQGLRRFVLCVGHGAEQIIGRYESRSEGRISFSREEQPLGTAGAIARALPLVRSEPFLVLNGDSLCQVSYTKLLGFHQTTGATLTIVGVPLSERRDTGAIRADQHQRVIEFVEKGSSAGPGALYTNAGIYVMTGAAMAPAKDKVPCSLEFDVFPVLAVSGRCFVFPAERPLVDIGTPERLRAANDLLG